MTRVFLCLPQIFSGWYVRGIYHTALHAYYLMLSLVYAYGDALASSPSILEGFAVFLRNLARVELVIAAAVFMDMARAPDCDISCRGTTLGSLAYLLVKPFVRSHRGGYHTVWAAIYAAVVSTTVVTAAMYALTASAVLIKIDVPFSTYYIATATFSASFLSYCLHLVEDSLTKRGVAWSSRRIRGPVSTGVSDLEFTLMFMSVSITGVLAAYLATGTPSTSALAGIAALAFVFALLTVVHK